MCPIGREVMLDPVSCANGHSYEQSHIEHWFEHNITSPLTGAVLLNKIIVSNHALRNLIQERHALCEVVEVDENTPPLAMQHRNELNGNCATFSTMQQQASASPMQSMQLSQEGANAQQPTNNPPAQERSDRG